VTIVWSPRSIEHLASLRKHIAREDPAAAGRVAETLLHAVERLAQFPNTGRPGRIAGTRELVVPRTRYIIPYRVRPARIEIVGVLHERQRWPTQR
jgi:addiction module RelE/StbE family toxin